VKEQVMQGWQFSSVGQPLEFVELPDPVPGHGELVLEPKVTGFCHSDVGYIDGSLTSVLTFTPIILGHEIAGVVSAVGGGVTDFAVGDRVAVLAGPGTPGNGIHGGFATKVLTPSEFVAKIPDNVSFEYAATSTDAGAASHRAVAVVGEVRAGMRVGIIGLGGLGSYGAQIAKGLGAEVYVADPNEKALENAKEFSYAKYASDITEFADDELEVIVDFAGFGTTTAGALDVIRPGGRIVQVGLGRPEVTISSRSNGLDRLQAASTI
jgi:D-arabinose 1-dehydrogenase-like Zn-dependent alcohol dehydrogenase